ncbi:MAG: SLBB domain-containing protein [Armatimonadetes bacterium]|nr:SLBB domain-containing protein [Armatimonadota bacterium]
MQHSILNGKTGLRVGVISAFLTALLTLSPASAQQAGHGESEAYRLQPGDEVAITVLPRKEYDTSSTILPDGNIHLKNIGSLKAVGLTVKELEDQVVKLLGKVLRRPRVTATVTKLGQPPTTPTVAISGAVPKAGPLPLEKDLRVRKALELAGGPLKDADLSRVRITHRDLTQTVVDLSRDEHVADPVSNPLLQEGDSVTVPWLTRINITVVGGVLRPGPLVEVEAGLRVLKALELAGGALRDADLSRVTITHSDLTQTVVDLSGDGNARNPAHNRPLEDGDSVSIPLLYKPGFVMIGGEVTNAGSYELKPGMTLEDLIVAAGKLTLMADVEHVELQRKSQPRQVVNLRERLQQGIGGKVVLEPGDEVHIPKHENAVILVGPIPDAGPRPLKPGQTLYDFFTQGEPGTVAALDESKVNLKSIQVLRPGEETRKVNLKSILAKRDSSQNMVLKGGDVIFLPARLQPKLSALDYLRALPFFGSLVGLFR